MMEDQDEVEEGESFNFSANASKQGEHYIEFSQEVIKDGKKIKPPKPCKVFNSEEWKQLVRNPTPTTLRNHMNSITVGSVSRQDYEPEHMYNTK